MLNVFRTRCRSARPRGRRVRATDRVDQVGAKNDAFAAQLEDFEAMATADAVCALLYPILNILVVKNS